MNANSIPSSAVVRVSRGNFDPGRFPAVDRVSHDIGGFLVPAIKRLDGLIGYYAGASPEGSMVHVSVWQSDEHANQMGRSKRWSSTPGPRPKRLVSRSRRSSTIRSPGPSESTNVRSFAALLHVPRPRAGGPQ